MKVPKIKLNAGHKRELCTLDFDCSTSANFGFVQPTMCREMIPNSKFEVSVRNVVRTAPMPVPTFGRMYLINKHVFVPYVDVCPQFDSFLAAQSYKVGALDSYIPNSLPSFDPVRISHYVLGQFADWTIYTRNINEFPDEGETPVEYKPFLIDSSDRSNTSLDKIKEIYNMLFYPATSGTGGAVYGRNMTPAQIRSYHGLMPSAAIFDGSRGSNDDRRTGNWLLGGYEFVGDNTMASTDANFTYQDDALGSPDGKFIATYTNNYVTLENADYISKFGTTSSSVDYIIAFKLRPTAKRFRQILIGLGYQFTPNLYSKIGNQNWLKLLAYYKAWFNLYRPKREMSFTSTTGYDMIKTCEIADPSVILYPDEFSLGDVVKRFINSLCIDMQYYLPQDYFGMSVTSPNANYQGVDTVIDSHVNSIYEGEVVTPNLFEIPKYDNVFGPRFVSNNRSTRSVDVSAAAYPQNIQLALKVLKYVNKNTIVGRSIHDYIKAHFGVSIDNSHDLENVFEIGEDRLPIIVDDVFSTAATDEDYLGNYAGKALAVTDDNDVRTHKFENKENFGVWLTLTTIIPRSGYYQGILRENSNLKRYDFFTPEFDALGYDVLLRDEVSADYPMQNGNFNPVTDIDLDLKKAFGFVPRYSNYKVGRNIVNGDLSLRGSRNEYAGYFLDRVIPYERLLPKYKYEVANTTNYAYPSLTAPSYIPSVVFDNFRRIDPSDRLGNYNRIFYDESVLNDHFIIHSVFDVKAYLPAMSLQDSFDTFDDNDGKTIEIAHS